jgi:hypothetical protein
MRRVYTIIIIIIVLYVGNFSNTLAELIKP